MNDDPIMEPEDPDDLGLPEEQKEKILSLMKKMMEMGVCAVYGQEDDGVPDADVDCGSNLKWCRAICCTFQFAFTKEDA